MFEESQHAATKQSNKTLAPKSPPLFIILISHLWGGKGPFVLYSFYFPIFLILASDRCGRNGFQLTLRL